uniref:Putative polar flagellar assembly protein FliO n=1 Tax=Magnetococcus massalia (strain MO-1) TaxID=451514 RepID=A0A1S7LKJ7_MAGMO|nr:putative polar flagellar assembly protein FliO [Candidatus Magnetococcus massalia]
MVFALPAWAAEQQDVMPTPDELDLTTQAVRIVGFLLVLIIIAGLVNRFGRRLHEKVGGGSGIDVISGRNLGHGVGVRVITIGQRGWLVGVSKEGVQLLAELNRDELDGLSGEKQR